MKKGIGLSFCVQLVSSPCAVPAMTKFAMMRSTQGAPS
jgi:hypothetical protein